jgi:hypothetical protein
MMDVNKEQELLPQSSGTFKSFFKELLSQGLRAMQAALWLRQLPMLSPFLMS